MTNLDFFIKGCQLGAYKYKEWALAIFCISTLPEEYIEEDHYPCRIYLKDGYPCFYRKDLYSDDDTGDFEYLTLNGKPIEYLKGENILYVDEGMVIGHNDIPSMKYIKTTTLQTTPGVFFFNWYCLMYGIGDKIPYVNDHPVNQTKIIESILNRVKDDLQPGQTPDPEAIYVSELKRTLNAINAFSGFSGINTPSATPYTISGAPGIREYRDKLLKQHEKQLDDPLVVADIQAKLLAYDKEYCNSDPNKGFYQNPKKSDIARMQLHCMKGIKNRLDPTRPSKLIKTSLSEEFDPADLPVINDELRHGSYSRGKMTALGGVGVKDAYRSFAACEITKEDCGTTLGYPVRLTKQNINLYLKSYFIDKNQTHLLTEENKEQFIGQVVLVRTPAFCKADDSGRSYCSKCFGEDLRGHEKSLASYAAEISSVMNTRFMKDMHGSRNDLIPIDFELALT